jgi:hypothetical protein
MGFRRVTNGLGDNVLPCFQWFRVRMKPPIIMGNNNTLERGWPQAVRLHIHTSEGKDRPFFLSTGTTIYSHVQLETARQAVQLGRTVSGLLSCFATVPLGRNNPALRRDVPLVPSPSYWTNMMLIQMPPA